MRLPLLLACLFTPAAFVAAGGDRPDPLRPKSITFAAKALPLPDALAEITARTGNHVADRRTRKTSPVVELPAGPQTFWPALDALGKQTGIAFSAYRDDGEVALIDATYRPLPVAYAGLFRVAARRLGVALDLEAGSHACTVGLDVAWEPRFQPFYLDVKDVTVTYAAPAGGKPRRESFASPGSVPVAGRSAAEVEIRVPAPDRSCPAIAVLEGNLWAVGPEAMHDFVFKDLTSLAAKAPPLTQTRDGTRVAVHRARFSRDVLSVEVEIENPKEGPVLESFQSWLDNNRIRLVEARTKRPLAPESNEVLALTANRARVVYHFTPAEGQRLPPRGLAGWELHYRTAGRLVEVREPFRLEKLALP
jgi:hypothetical protein